MAQTSVQIDSENSRLWVMTRTPPVGTTEGVSGVSLTKSQVHDKPSNVLSAEMSAARDSRSSWRRRRPKGEAKAGRRRETTTTTGQRTASTTRKRLVRT